MRGSTGYIATKALQPYYRDTLSKVFSFPDFVATHRELLEWAIHIEHTDVQELLRRLAQADFSGADPQAVRALKAMLEAIVRSNAVLEVNNPQHMPLPSQELERVNQLLQECLSLAAHLHHFENTITLLFRTNQIDDLVALVRNNGDIAAQSPLIRHVMGFISTIEGGYSQALGFYAPIRTQLQQFPLADICCLSAEFYLGLWPQQPVSFDTVRTRYAQVDLAGLPPLEIQQRTKSDGKTILVVACDEKYFYEHAIPLAYSLDRTNRGKLALHLHLYSPGADVLVAVERLRARLPWLEIGLSSETMPVAYAAIATIYYSCIRFVRLHQLQACYPDSALCMVDADSLIRSPWDIFCARVGVTPQTDVALIYRPAAPPWERVTAGCLYVATSAAGKQYLADVAAFIAHNFARGSIRWFLDQMALGAVFEVHHRKAAGFVVLPFMEASDLNYLPDSFLWVVTNFKNRRTAYQQYRNELRSVYES